MFELFNTIWKIFVWINFKKILGNVEINIAI